MQTYEGSHVGVEHLRGVHVVVRAAEAMQTPRVACLPIETPTTLSGCEV